MSWGDVLGDVPGGARSTPHLLEKPIIQVDPDDQGPAHPIIVSFDLHVRPNRGVSRRPLPVHRHYLMIHDDHVELSLPELFE
jgi:hypothetical protein